MPTMYTRWLVDVVHGRAHSLCSLELSFLQQKTNQLQSAKKKGQLWSWSIKMPDTWMHCFVQDKGHVCYVTLSTFLSHWTLLPETRCEGNDTYIYSDDTPLCCFINADKYSYKILLVWGSGGITPHVIKLGTRKLVISFALRHLYPGIHWLGDWVAPRAGLGVVCNR